MPIFRWEARSADGELVAGRSQATSRDAVLADLRGRGLSPIRLSEASGPVLKRRVSAHVLSDMFRNLSDLLSAGVPLLRAIRLLAGGKAHPRMARLLGDVADDIADGATMADAMAAHPDVFTHVHAAMIRAGEQGGFLDAVLDDLADLLERQSALRSRVIGNMIYPAILVVSGLGAIIYAMVAFVPKFEPYFDKIEVPAATRWLLASSAFFLTWWPGLIVVAIAVIVAAWTLRGNASVRSAMGVALLRTPVVAAIVRDVAVARLGRLLGTMIDSGVGVLPALEIGEASAGQPQLEQAVAAAAAAVRSGESMAEPLGSTGVLTRENVEMISVAEAANALPKVLIQISDASERRVDRRLDLLLRLMEPALLLVVAAMVVFIFAALVLPMMRMGTAVG